MPETTIRPPEATAPPAPGGPPQRGGPPAPGGPPNPEQAMQRLLLMSLPWVCQSVYVAAKLGVADHLDDDEPMAIAELAALTDAHTSSLYRFCRALAAIDLLVEHDGRRFTLAPMGRTLRSDDPGSLRAFVIVNGEEPFRAWGDVLYSVRTGRSAFERMFGMNHFEYLSQNAEANQVFHAMAGSTPEVLEQCDLSDAGTIVDLGGGRGALIATLLQRYPHARGIVQDLPEAVAEAPEHLARQGVADRCDVVGRSFFDGVPAGGDVYVLSRVVHDWSDGDARRLLRGVHARMGAGSRLLVIDQMTPDVPGFHPGKFADLQMLVVLGGKERTLDELHKLLGECGFRVTGVHPPAVPKPRAETAVWAVPVPVPVSPGGAR